MSFDYPNTCPAIDRYIKEAKENIENQLKDIVYQLSPLFYEVENQRDSIVKTWAEEIYSDLESIFEDVRSTNSDMRESAESQIEQLERRISDLESEIEYKNEKILDF